MAFEFELPDVGEGVAEGTLENWLVEAGDTVSEDQPVAEVETDKALVEVPAPVNGTVKELLWEPGDVIPVGDVFIVFDVEGEESEAADTEADAGDAAGADAGAAAETGAEATDGTAEEVETPEGRVFASPSTRQLARELGVAIEAVEGTGPGGRITDGDVRAAAEDGEEAEPEPEPEPTTEAPESGSTGAEATAEAGTTAGAGGVESADRDRTLAAPATRRIAEEEGVDIDAVPTSEERDGEAFVSPEAVREYAEAQQAAQAEQVEAVSETPAGERVERLPYSGVRRTIGEAMAQSKYTAPHVTHHDTAVVDALVETREDLKPRAEERGFRLTYMPFVMKAVVAALKEHPKLNAELDEDAGEILRYNYYNVGIATATDAGLMVPVVEDVDSKGMLQLSGEVNELVQKARERSISRDELQGSTFSITNFGAIGGEYATPILNYPEVGILGIGELKQRPVVEDSEAQGASGSRAKPGDGEVVARHTLPISLTIDHRIVDGADAASFANTVIEYLENPSLLLLE
jgi:pyruvate dehydrogenase E2 component (dihydrolipoamide acetyltransferase)